MHKKLWILVVIVLILMVGAFWMTSKRAGQNVLQESLATELISGVSKFVTDVDPDVNHWQTKETDYFTIRFPKEWYWMESNLEMTGYHSKIITNNPSFEIDKHADIAVFSDIGPTSPITIINDSELVITNRGFPTSNAGAPSDALDSIFELAQRNYPTAHCVRPDNSEILPIIAHCGAEYSGDQTQLSYYVIDKNWSLTITLRKRGDSDALQSIVENIARNIRINY